MIKNNTALVTALWILGLIGLAFFANRLLPYDPSFPYSGLLATESKLPQWIYSWGNFDGVHYLAIVLEGYARFGLVQAFFPVFPVSAQVLYNFTKNAFVSLWLVNAVGFLVFLVGWRKLVLLDSDEKTAFWSWVSIILFPTSFFFLAIYTESLFLACVVWSFVFARSKNWVAASLVAAVASATRVIGIFLLPALLLELWLQHRNYPVFAINRLRQELQHLGSFLLKNIGTIAIIFTSSFGLLAYMWYLQQTFDDPLYFFHVQSEFGAGREESIILLPQVIWRYLKILATYRPFDLKYLAFVQEFGLALLSLGMLAWSSLKIRSSYVLFSLLAWLLPTLTGTLSSMPRYILVCFPLYLLLGSFLSNQKKLRLTYFLVSIPWLALNTILFIQGYWVA